MFAMCSLWLSKALQLNQIPTFTRATLKPAIEVTCMLVCCIYLGIVHVSRYLYLRAYVGTYICICSIIYPVLVLP